MHVNLKKNARLIKVLTILLFYLILPACNGENKEDLTENEPESEVVQEEVKNQEEDLSKNVAIINEGVDKDFKENKKKIEKKYGNQWDFCRCVIANDSLDRLVKSGAELGDDFMKSFEEVDVKCKAFLVMNPNNTPEERMLHEKKIKECLKANK